MVAPRVAGLWIVMSTCYRRYVVWAAASPLPFSEIHATWQKIIAQSFRLALAWMYEAMWRAVHSPFTCVVCHRLLVRHRAAITQARAGPGVTVCVCVVERWQPHAEACTLCLSLNRGERPLKKRKKNTISCCRPAPRPFSS